MPTQTPPYWSPARALLAAWLVAGTLDISEVIIFAGIRGMTGLGRIIPPHRIFQGVASGWYGADSFNGGTQTAIVGFLTHYLIALGLVTVYFLASRRIPLLVTHPVRCGMLYGLLVFAFMNLVVLPLSKAGVPKYTTVSFVNQLFCHIILIGISTAVLLSRSRPSGALAGTAQAVPLPAS